MIRGIDRVIAPENMEVGRFYVSPGMEGEPVLFQWVSVRPLAGVERQMALLFPYEGLAPIELQEALWYDAVIAMPAVEVRVDPPSAFQSGGRGRVVLNSLMAAGDQPCIAVKNGARNHIVINLTTGMQIDQAGMELWVSFSRWSLVVDEAGEEVTIAGFDRP
jgi:hypothetical protein